MTHRLTRRALVAAGLASALPARAARPTPARPLRIYAITFRGMTDVEKGFSEYFASRRIPVQIVHRDLNRDPTRMPGFLEEIRATRPDLIYTWGTSVTLGVVGPYDAIVPGLHITDIPVVYTMVAAPLLAKINRNMAAPTRNVTGVTHVGSIDIQVRAMAQYRPFKTLGMLYTPTEQNSVAVLQDIHRLGRENGFRTEARAFRLDAARKPTAAGVAEMVRDIKEAGAEWLYLPPDSFLGTLAEELVIPAATESGLPTFASTEQLMQAGALSGLVSRYYNVGQFTARKVEQLLVEKLPVSAVPVETLKRFSYQIRMPVARRLNMPPPLKMFGYAELIDGERPDA